MPRRMFAAACLSAAVLAGAAGLHAQVADPPRNPIVLKDLSGQPVDPFAAARGSAAVVVIFASVDCPISNRYAPVVQRLHTEYGPKNVAFWLVYPNPSDTPDAVRKHVADFSYPVRPLLDPRHELVKLARVSVTPEGAVFDRTGRLVYHGRIDNRYVTFGVERPAATEHDLAQAIGAVLDGRAVANESAPAIGCYIADFVQ